MFFPHASHTPYLEGAGRSSDNHSYRWCRSAIGDVSDNKRKENNRKIVFLALLYNQRPNNFFILRVKERTGTPPILVT
jgi:hypothetical protein